MASILGLISAVGDYVLAVGLVYLVYDLTGSTLASAGMLVVSVLPQFLLASAAGLLVDRWDRRRTLGLTLFLQVLVLSPLLAVTGDSRIWIFVRDVLHGGPQGYGLVVGIQAVGGVLGGLVVATLAAHVRPARLLAGASIVFGLVDLVIFLYPLVWVSLAPAVVLMALVGIPAAAVTAAFMTLLQQGTTDAFRGRVFGTLLGLRAGGVLTGSLLAGWLGRHGDLSIVATIAWQGAGYVLMGVVVAATLVPGEPATVGRVQPLDVPAPP